MAEFNIRLFSFNRMEERKDLRTREIAYNSYISGSIQLKKIPTKKQFWNLGIEKETPKINKQALAMFKQAQQEYNNRNNGKQIRG